MGNKNTLTPDAAYQIKQELWNGASYQDVMSKYGVTYQMATGMRAGRAYAHIPWPDGSVGPMGDMQKAKLSNSKGFNTRMNKALGAPQTPKTAMTLEDAQFFHEMAQKLGFATIEEAMEHTAQALEEERVRKMNEENEKYLAEYRKNNSDPKFLAAKRKENEEAARRRAKDHLPDDQCDPSAIPDDKKYEWDELQIIAAGYPAVQVVLNDEESEENEALKHALCFVLREFRPSQWNQEHCVRMVQIIKQKILNFWNAKKKAA